MDNIFIINNSTTVVKILKKRLWKHNRRYWEYKIILSNTPKLDYGKTFKIPAKDVPKYLKPASDAIKILYGQE